MRGAWSASMSHNHMIGVHRCCHSRTRRAIHGFILRYFWQISHSQKCARERMSFRRYWFYVGLCTFIGLLCVASIACASFMRLRFKTTQPKGVWTVSKLNLSHRAILTYWMLLGTFCGFIVLAHIQRKLRFPSRKHKSRSGFDEEPENTVTVHPQPSKIQVECTNVWKSLSLDMISGWNFPLNSFCVRGRSRKLKRLQVATSHCIVSNFIFDFVRNW